MFKIFSFLEKVLKFGVPLKLLDYCFRILTGNFLKSINLLDNK